MNRDNQTLMRCVLTEATAADLEKRYEHRRRLWDDGPYGGSIAFDKVMEREVRLYIAYNFSDIPAFIRHAKVRGRLRHPHLLPVLDLGVTADKLPYFTEPFVEALPLDSVLRTFNDRLPFSLPQLVQALTGVCQAVAYAHENGVCHLDLNPGNVHADCTLDEVFVAGGWEEAAAPPAAGTERLIGHCFSPGYAAPEQVRSSPQELVQQGLWRLVDVHGLGSIIYYVLYASPPNQVRPGGDSSQANLIQVLISRQGAPHPGQLRPALQAIAPKAVLGLERIALKALHSEPRQRYPAVSEMVEDLKEWFVDHRNNN
jgi:serine/threonine protein kinase